MPRSKAGVAEAVERTAGAGAAADSPHTVTSSSTSAVTASDRPNYARGGALRLPRDELGRLPEVAQLGFVVVLSFLVDLLGQAVLHAATKGELESITKHPKTTAEVALLVSWRVFGLTLGWSGGYDGYDLAALALLSSGPATYLTTVFYGLRGVTAAAYLLVEVVSAFLPFLLLRRLSDAHSAAHGVPNREIVVDRGIQVLTSLLSALVYSTVLFLVSRTYLPNALVLHFEGIPTIRPAADAVLLGLDNPLTQAFCLLFGIAARTFIFTPLVTTPRTVEEDQEIAKFDPVGASLGETVAFNLWGFTGQTKVSIKRTALVMLFSAVGTYCRVVGIRGVESFGAILFSSVWVIAAFVTGLLLRFVGSV